MPANSSLSYTLNHLRSFVTIEPAAQDSWAPLDGFSAIALSETGLKKFLKHFQMLKSKWAIEGQYLIRSANNFASDCGLASSASSFAALTLATWELAKAIGHAPDENITTLSKLSRLGSGSSCRSLFSPWAIWRGEGAEKIDLDLHLEHAVLIAGTEKKAVSSSEAHVRVTTSLLFEGRVARADKRLEQLLSSLKSGDWKQSFELCWSEFWDMHALFESSQPSFGYMNGETLKILSHLREIWTTTDDGPLVTMDAGANVHILLRSDQTRQAEKWIAPFVHRKSWS